LESIKKESNVLSRTENKNLLDEIVPYQLVDSYRTEPLEFSTPTSMAILAVSGTPLLPYGPTTKDLIVSPSAASRILLYHCCK
jgi:hypothetical protein